MNKVPFGLVMLGWFMVVDGYAQPYQKTDFGIRSTIRSINVEIQFYSPSLVRVLKSPEGTTVMKQSLSVIQASQKTAFGIQQDGDELFLKSERIHVSLNQKNGKIAFTTASGEPLFREKESGVEFTDFQRCRCQNP